MLKKESFLENTVRQFIPLGWQFFGAGIPGNFPAGHKQQVILEVQTGIPGNQ
jgi:hypothetical protein